MASSMAPLISKINKNPLAHIFLNLFETSLELKLKFTHTPYKGHPNIYIKNNWKLHINVRETSTSITHETKDFNCPTHSIKHAADLVYIKVYDH